MSKWRQKRSAPHKLREFYLPDNLSTKDGTGGTTAHTQGGQMESAVRHTLLTTWPPNPSIRTAAQSPPLLLQTQPNKTWGFHRQKTHYIGRPLFIAPPVGTVLHNSKADFPTTNQPVLDTTLRDILMTAQSSICSEIINMMQHFSSDMSHMGERVSNRETKMGEVTASFNEDIAWIKAKMADLEDRPRRNNENKTHSRVLSAICFKILLHTTSGDFSIWLPIKRVDNRPHSPSAKTSSSTRHYPKWHIALIHFFHIKERFMRAARNAARYPQQYTNFSFYDDLLKYTMQQSKNLATITKPLRNHQIPNKWRHPVKLIIIRPLEEGLTLLQQ